MDNANGNTAPPRLLWLPLDDQHARPPEASGFKIETGKPSCIDPLLCQGTHAAALIDLDRPLSRHLKFILDLRLRAPRLPLVMMTGLRCETLAIWALRARLHDLLLKPFRAEELRCALQRSLRWSGDWRASMAPAPTLVSEAIAKALDHIRCNFTAPLREQDVAIASGMDVFSFSRRFKKETGQTFRTYLLRYRIAAAKELLATSQASVTDVALSVGFNDPSGFTKHFRESMGQTPTEFRRQLLVSDSFESTLRASGRFGDPNQRAKEKP